MVSSRSFDSIAAINQNWQAKLRAVAAREMISSDGAHDLMHIERVVVNAEKLLAEESADAAIVLPAAWLHDCVAVAKDAPERNQASRLAAYRAVELLREIEYFTELIPSIAHAIESHSFSADIPPQTMEAKIVQDADRLDALGAIGLARCFMTAGTMGGQLYSPDDPLAVHRTLDDRHFAIDHFFKKLLKLPEQMQTAAGRRLGEQRATFLVDFLSQLSGEVGWNWVGRAPNAS